MHACLCVLCVCVCVCARAFTYVLCVRAYVTCTPGGEQWDDNLTQRYVAGLFTYEKIDAHKEFVNGIPASAPAAPASSVSSSAKCPPPPPPSGQQQNITMQSGTTCNNCETMQSGTVQKGIMQSTVQPQFKPRGSLGDPCPQGPGRGAPPYSPTLGVLTYFFYLHIYSDIPSIAPCPGSLHPWRHFLASLFPLLRPGLMTLGSDLVTGPPLYRRASTEHREANR